MEFFKSLHAFQRKASILKLDPSDRLVYFNLILRANIERSSSFEMTASELAFYTGLCEKTIHRSKRRLKNLGFIDFHKQRLDLSDLCENESPLEVQRKVPHLQRNKINGMNKRQKAQAHEKFSFQKAPKWDWGEEND